MTGRFLESERRQMEMGEQRRDVGRKHKNNSRSTAISFVFGEKVAGNSTKTEVNEQGELSAVVKTEAESQNSTEVQNYALVDLDWVNNSQKSHVLLQMMNAMGYEHGKGLGKRGQGIVEPIKTNPNQGKKAFGANHDSRRKGRRRRRTRESGHMEGQQTDSGKNAIAEQQQKDEWKRRPNPSRRAQMHYEDNVRDTLRTAGLSEQSAEEIWQALGILARHQIMPLGMGLGLVKRRAGRRRIEMEDKNEGKTEI